MKRATLFFLLLFVAGCPRAPSPEAALRAYREALARGDAAGIRALSDAGFRETWSEARLERWLAKNPRLLEETLARTSEGELRTEAILESEGERFRMVLEEDGWRVAEGGLLVARFDTPEAALETFFFAATGHLGLLRKLIPEESVARYASDHALARHLYAERDRIFRARDELGPISEGMAEIEGDRARVAYGDGKAVELVRQHGRWRVLDVE